MATQLATTEPTQERKAVAAIRNTQLDAGAPGEEFLSGAVGNARRTHRAAPRPRPRRDEASRQQQQTRSSSDKLRS